MKKTALSAVIVLSLTGNAFGDDLSKAAVSDIGHVNPVKIQVMQAKEDAKAAPVGAIHERGAPLASDNVQLMHIKVPEYREGSGGIALFVGDTGTISSLKSIIQNDAGYAFLLGLSMHNHAAYDVLTRLVVIKELAQLHRDLIDQHQSALSDQKQANLTDRSNGLKPDIDMSQAMDNWPTPKEMQKQLSKTLKQTNQPKEENNHGQVRSN